MRGVLVFGLPLADVTGKLKVGQEFYRGFGFVEHPSLDFGLSSTAMTLVRSVASVAVSNG